MPVIQPNRQGLNIGGVQLQANEVNLPPTVGDVVVDTSKANRLAALSGFVQDFGIGFDAAVKETRANGNDAAEITRLARMKAAACEEIAEEQVALAAAQAELQA